MANHEAEPDRVALTKSVTFEQVKAGRDDVALTDGVAGNGLMSKILQDHIKQQVAAYKHARRIVCRGALPRTRAGKIQ